MPTYSHICQNTECNHEWDDIYSISVDPPKICPKCNQETAKRVIGFATAGNVQLFGQDLVDKVKADAAQLQRDAAKSENIYSNLLGHDKYENLQKRIDKQKRR